MDVSFVVTEYCYRKRENNSRCIYRISTGEKTHNVALSAECEQCCKNVQALLNEVGLGLEDVVENTCFLVDMNDFEAFNEAYAKYFTGKPARTCIAVRELPAGIKCEIKSIAYRSK